MNPPDNPFLAEVLANPDDDVPRLVYADWLEEQGDPRGEFIRVQCELAQSDELQPEYYDLQTQNRRLLKEHGDAWAKEVKQDVRKVEFDRGFVATITMRARAFAKEGEALVNSAPVNWLRFNFLKNAGAAVGNSAALEKVRCLDLSGLVFPSEDFAAILRSPHLTNLQRLKLYFPSETTRPDGVMGNALSKSPSASVLQSLELLPSTVEGDFYTALASGPGFPQLEHLSLGSSYDNSNLQGLKSLRVPQLYSLALGGTLNKNALDNLACIPWQQLKSLDLGNATLKASACKQLIKLKAFDQLETFIACKCEALGQVSEIFAGERLSQCRRLNLRPLAGVDADEDSLWEYDNGPSDFEMTLAVEEVAGNKHLKNLECLWACELNDEDIATLAAARQFGNLKLFSIGKSSWSGPAAEALRNSALPQQLRVLRLRGDFTAEGLHALAETAFPNLLELSLGDCFAEEPGDLDSAMADFLNTSQFPQLRLLNLSHAQVGEQSLKAIAGNATFSNVGEIRYFSNQESDESLREILTSKHLPNLHTFRVMIDTQSSVRKEFADRIQ